MRSRDFDRIMFALGQMAPGQLRLATERVKTLNNAREALNLAEQRIQNVGGCQACGAEDYRPWGYTQSGMRRYRCRSCLGTFTALSGTKYNRVHDKAKLVQNAACMADFLSVRKTARKLQVHRNTAFRLRHLMMPELEKHQPETLQGVAEADEMFFRKSYKGQRGGLPRYAHKRGSPAKKRGLSSEQVPVFTALARGSTQSLVTVLPRPATADALADILRPVLTKDAVLCADSGSACNLAGAKLGVLVRKIPRGMHKLGPYHIQNANALHSRIRNRMRPFRGVATKYLPVYLGWVRFFDRLTTQNGRDAFLRDALGLPPIGSN
jgi:transposase-like protein